MFVRPGNNTSQRSDRSPQWSHSGTVQSASGYQIHSYWSRSSWANENESNYVKLVKLVKLVVMATSRKRFIAHKTSSDLLWSLTALTVTFTSLWCERIKSKGCTSHRWSRSNQHCLGKPCQYDEIAGQRPIYWDGVVVNNSATWH